MENELKPLTEKEREAAETRQRILDYCEKLFMKLGIRSITMDDIARNLGMSKKTIYLYFKDKDDLVHEMCLNHFEKEKCEWQNIEANSPTALHELLELVKHFIAESKIINPSLLYDLQKYHPRSWAVIHDTKICDIRRHMEELLQRGIAEGLFRAEINTKILAQFRVASVEMGFNQDYFPHTEFNTWEVQITLLDIFVRSILNIKGTEEWSKMEGKIINTFTNNVLINP